jgi:UDP-N-acetylglucosamine 4-epimerase
MTDYEQRIAQLGSSPRTWLVTGVAGFIGSNILQGLLAAGQRVIGLDNFVTGSQTNLAEVERDVGGERWKNLRFMDGDIRDLAVCQAACREVDFVLHQAALGSVPLSLEQPAETHAVNVTGFLNMLQAARDQGIRRFVYASSCAVYGDETGSAKVEERVGNAISPYAAGKRMDELYADVFTRCYQLPTVGLRYFNIYGPRQDPNGAYAAVIPKWMSALWKGEPITIYGDGQTSRDFCFVQDVVQANVLAATSELAVTENPGGLVCNVGTGAETSLNELSQTLSEIMAQKQPDVKKSTPVYGKFRAGDIRQSCADISRAREQLGFVPRYDLRKGLSETFAWYVGKGDR